jgi:hypothetical protein
MQYRTSTSCSTSCSTATPTWRRIFRWPLFCALAVVHLALLPLVLGETDDQVIAMIGGLAYLVLAALDWRSRRTAAPA